MNLPTLATFERAWAESAFDALFPEGTALPHGIRRMDPGPALDAFLAETPLEQSLGIRVALWIVALAPIFTLRRLGTISSIAEEDRGRVLDRLVTSPIYAVRQLVLGLKAVASLLYLQSDEIRAHMLTPMAAPLTTLRTRRDEDSKKHGGIHEHAAE